MAASHILVLDQGTTSTRAIAFDLSFRPRASAQIELTQHYPEPGWVEHDPEEIWRAALQVAREAIDAVGGPQAVAAIGVTNQRETSLIWDRADGRCIHPAIVWQDRRTDAACQTMRAAGLESAVQTRTGLLLDPYFSATKIAWLLDHVASARARAAQGALAFGTVDAFLLWRLTGGRTHATDPTNAARTLLFGLETAAWDDELLQMFGVPRALLPSVCPSAGLFGETDPALFGRAIPITGIAGDQQAAIVGHGCLSPGAAKATYGTGGFLMVNAGGSPPVSTHRLLATIAYEAAGARAYALEGAIFSVGSTVQWLKDIGLLQASRESEAMAAQLADNGGVYLVPAFAGLGAPQWRAGARGAVFGLTRDAGAAHLVRAGLEAIAYQTRDLLDALALDGAPTISVLRVDGGVTANSWAMQFLADICGVSVERPAFQEVTALGAARLAAFGAGLTDRLDAAAEQLAPQRFEPRMGEAERARLRAGWGRAVAGTLAAAGEA